MFIPSWRYRNLNQLILFRSKRHGAQCQSHDHGQHSCNDLLHVCFLVLDEATAYADPENEHQIQKAFDGLIKNKTVIMVAHRLSTVQDADQILVMKNGAIAESGTHSDLIKHQGEYAKMWDNYNKTVQWHIES